MTRGRAAATAEPGSTPGWPRGRRASGRIPELSTPLRKRRSAESVGSFSPTTTWTDVQQRMNFRHKNGCAYACKKRQPCRRFCVSSLQTHLDRECCVHVAEHTREATKHARHSVLAKDSPTRVGAAETHSVV